MDQYQSSVLGDHVSLMSFSVTYISETEIIMACTFACTSSLANVGYSAFRNLQVKLSK